MPQQGWDQGATLLINEDPGMDYAGRTRYCRELDDPGLYSRFHQERIQLPDSCHRAIELSRIALMKLCKSVGGGLHGAARLNTTYSQA